MASEFQASLVAFGDVPGLGLWEAGHYRQHLDYNNHLAARSPPVIIPVFPIMDMIGFDNERLQQWLQQHELWHEQIRPYANVTDVDLSTFDITNPTAFANWQQLHESEHAAIDQAFGLS